MEEDAVIQVLLEEAGNAKAWFAQYAKELKNDPKNEGLLRLQELCRSEFEKRWDRLIDMGATADGVLKRPRIDE
jgi:hypothetical protein